jgi:hypothetical protein
VTQFEIDMRDIKAMLWGEGSEPIDAPTVDEVLDRVRPLLLDLERVLEERGRVYGEDVLVEMGEAGIATLCLIKVRRLMGNIESGFGTTVQRWDSWMDLAGYAILAMALERWKGDQK